MAYSPSPHPAGLPGPGHTANASHIFRNERLSPSPSNQQSINKRDKRRIALQDRLNDIVVNFSSNRDLLYRRQLQQFQADINFINNAPLYNNEPLLEPGEEEQELVLRNGGVASSDWPRHSQQAFTNGNTKLDSYPRLGRNAARFLEDVNDTVERRDADLVTLAYRHNYAIDQLEKDFQFSVEVAEREHQRLLDSLRQRLIQNVNQKMATLQRDKEKLDIADTNALLHHPTQFSMNNVASPGGPQSNRKTRHTRHRLEAEEADSAINSNNGSNKRKRKNALESRNPSPAPPVTREVEHVIPNGVRDIHSRPSVASTPMVYTLDRLFTDRELTANLQQATYDVIQSRSTSSSTHSTKRRKLNGVIHNSAANLDGLLPANVEAGEPSDEASITQEHMPLTSGPDGESVPLIAPAIAMDRTPSQLYHATRSAGRVQASSTPHNTLGSLAGRQAAADLIGSYGGRGNEKSRRDGDEYQRAPPLNEIEASEDVRLMEEAMKREEEREERSGSGNANGGGSGVNGGGVGGNGARGEGEEEGEGDEGVNDGEESETRLLNLVLGDPMVDHVGPPGFAKGGVVVVR